MQHGDLDKTKVLKIQRDSKSDERKPSFESVLKSLLSVRPVEPIPELGVGLVSNSSFLNRDVEITSW
jgi:hypothetical protein